MGGVGGGVVGFCVMWHSSNVPGCEVRNGISLHIIGVIGR